VFEQTQRKYWQLAQDLSILRHEGARMSAVIV
jgi:hypothetical protein